MSFIEKYTNRVTIDTFTFSVHVFPQWSALSRAHSEGKCVANERFALRATTLVFDRESRAEAMISQTNLDRMSLD